MTDKPTPSIDYGSINGEPFTEIDWRPIEEMPTPVPELYQCLGTNGFFLDLITFLPRKPDDDREGPGWFAYHGDVTPSHFAYVQPLSRAQRIEESERRRARS